MALVLQVSVLVVSGALVSGALVVWELPALAARESIPPYCSSRAPQRWCTMHNLCSPRMHCLICGPCKAGPNAMRIPPSTTKQAW
jgi:hypothetical protein